MTLWTEGTGADASANFLIHASSVVAVRGTPDQVAHVEGLLIGLPDDTIGTANSLAQQLKTTPPSGDDLGVVVAGVNNQRGVLWGLHSSRQYDAVEFNPAIVEGFPAYIFEYLHAQLRGLLVTEQDALDFLMLNGDIHTLVLPGLPRVGTAMRVVGEGSPEMVPPEEMARALARNVTRLRTLRTKIIDLLL